MKKERLKWVDVAKGIAIFLVVFTHAPMFMPSLESMKGIIITVGAFHMPLFFFVYGITCSSKRKSISEWKAFLEKRIKGLLIPYIIWAFLYGKLNAQSVPLILWGTNLALGTAESNAVLWFLPVMFITCILYELYVQLKLYYFDLRHVVTCVCVMLCIIVSRQIDTIWTPYGLFGGVNIAITCVIFMIAGESLKPVIGILYKKHIIMNISLILGIIICGTYVSRLNADENVGGYIVAYANYGKNYYIYIINAICMCFMVVVLSFFLEKLKFLVWMGKYSMAIMVMHYFVFEYTVPICTNLISINGVFAAFINTCLTIIVCVPFVLVFERLIPEIIGKTLPSNM